MMRRPSRISLLLLVGLLPLLLEGCTKASGMGQYCSVTDPSGVWDFRWTGNDPCKDILTEIVPGGTIQRAGLYSKKGDNNVVLRCDKNFVSTHKGPATLPMAYARGVIAKDRKNCIFTVAPKEMPVFGSPFVLDTPGITPGTGFDFAKPPYNTLNLQEFGQSGPTAATMVNNKAMDRSGTNYIDDHDAYDWGMPRKTPLYAVANGQVLKARNHNTECKDSDSPVQGEVYIQHIVHGDNEKLTTYHEKFVSSYFHLDSFTVSDDEVVTKGQLIGYSGHTGCSSGPHLHFAVMRLTNTATKLSEDLVIDSNGNDGWRIVIDPYGFDSTYGFDPWGIKAFGMGWGALSINLWNEGEAPPVGNW